MRLREVQVGETIKKGTDYRVKHPDGTGDKRTAGITFIVPDTGKGRYFVEDTDWE